jgi:hypothetical protein
MRGVSKGLHSRTHRHKGLLVFMSHTSAYVSIRQHTSAYVSIRQHTSARASTAARIDIKASWCLSSRIARRKALLMLY